MQIKLLKSKNPIIEVKVASEGNNIKISVSDNGKGISEALKDLIFEPKFTTKSSGMGLRFANDKKYC